MRGWNGLVETPIQTLLSLIHQLQRIVRHFVISNIST